MDSAVQYLTRSSTALDLAQALSDSLPSPNEPAYIYGSNESNSAVLRGESLSRRETPSLGHDHIHTITEDWQFEPENLFGNSFVPLSGLQKLDQQRFRLAKTRLRVRESRKLVSLHRSEVVDRHAHYLQDLRALLLNDRMRELDRLLKEFDELQELHDSVLAEEEEYDALEKSLMVEEWELRKGEKDLYREHAGVMAGALQFSREWNESEVVTDPGYLPSESDTSSGTYGVSLPPRAPLAVGAEAIRARLDKIEAENKQLVEEEKMRKAVGLTLDEDSSFLLRTFSLRQQELLEQLACYEDDDQHEKRAAYNVLEEDLFPAHQFTGYDLEHLGRMNSSSDASDPIADIAGETMSFNDSFVRRHPLLLGEYEISLVFAQFAHHGEAGSFSLYVNDWLLDKLRCSSFEVMQLNSYLENATHQSDSQQRIDLVLEWWYRDETKPSASQSLKQAESSVSTVSRESAGLHNPRAASNPILPSTHHRWLGREGRSKSLFARSVDPSKT